MDLRRAIEEATRCLLCHEPPCKTGCPARIDPRAFIRKIRLGDLAGAARHLRNHNILAGSCADLCPTLDLCEGACLREKLSHPIDIAGLQRFVCRWEREADELEVERITSGRGGVAVVGAGPAGLACAAELARRGISSTIFDRARAAGGVLHSAIPEYRLSQDVLQHDISLVSALGVEFRLGEEIETPEKLLDQGFAAVFVALGAGRSAHLAIPGAD